MVHIPDVQSTALLSRMYVMRIHNTDYAIHIALHLAFFLGSVRADT